jgi:hypothetical protein
LKQKFVNSRARWVCLSALGQAVFAVPLRVDIEAAAGKQDSLYAGKEFGDAILTFMERHKDGGCAGGT